MPFFVKLLALTSSHTKINANITMAVIKDGTNAAVDGVPRLSIAITFWIDGEPGADMDHVQQPAEIATGISRHVRLDSLKRFSAIG